MGESGFDSLFQQFHTIESGSFCYDYNGVFGREGKKIVQERLFAFLAESFKILQNNHNKSSSTAITTE